MVSEKKMHYRIRTSPPPIHRLINRDTEAHRHAQANMHALTHVRTHIVTPTPPSLSPTHTQDIFHFLISEIQKRHIANLNTIFVNIESAARATP